MLTHITTKIKLNFVDMKKLLFFLFFFWWLLNFACSVASVMSDSLQPHGLYTSRLLNPWIFPARTLEYAAMASSRGSSQTRDRTLMSCIFYITDGSITAEPPRELGYLILENHKYPALMYLSLFIESMCLGGTKSPLVHLRKTNLQNQDVNLEQKFKILSNFPGLLCVINIK